MSVSPNGRVISCNGKDCQRSAQLPVALNGSVGYLMDAESPEGWLFVACGMQRFHFCPECIPGYLRERRQFVRHVFSKEERSGLSVADPPCS